MQQKMDFFKNFKLHDRYLNFSPISFCLSTAPTVQIPMDSVVIMTTVAILR